MTRSVTFFIGDDEYAIALSRVHELVSEAGLTPVPTAPAFVAGLLNLHGAAVPVVDLCRRFAPGRERAEGQRSVLVLQMRLRGRAALVGLVIDALGRVITVDPEQVQPPPPLDAVVGVEFLTGVLERDGRFLLCLDVDRLLGAEEADHLAALADETAHAAPRIQPRAARVTCLCIRLGGERCAVLLSSLDEITPSSGIAPIPGAAPFVMGATNVRGSILPVVDVGRRYGLSETPWHADSCLLLATPAGGDGQGQVAMRVDEVEGLFHVAAADVRTTPPFGTRLPAEVVQAMVPIAGDFVPVLDLDHALADEASGRRAALRGPSAPADEARVELVHEGREG